MVFQKYINEIFNFPVDVVNRLFWIIIASLAFIGFYSYVFIPDLSKFKRNQQQNGTRKTGHIESAIVFGSVNLLFLFFIIIQFTYLFGGQSNITAQGFTYADYTRKGFAELVTVAIISLFLLLVTEKNVGRAESGHTTGFRLLSSALVVQVIMIIASAFMRLLLYERAYGFTNLRLYTHCFDIWLALVFIFVLFKILYDRRDNILALRIFISMVLYLAFMNIFNPDSYIARQNIERYYRTGLVDTDYLGSLSDDAVPVLVKALNSENNEKLLPLANQLSERYSSWRNSTYYYGWQSFNISRKQAENILTARIDELNSMAPDVPDDSGQVSTYVSEY